MKNIVLTFITLTLSIVAFGQAQDGAGDSPATESVVEMKELSTTDYSINYPRTWESDQSGLMGSTFFLFSEASSENDKFRENVNLVIQDLSAINIDLEQYTEISVRQIETLFQDAVLIENTTLVDNKNRAYQKLVYTATQGVFKLKFVQKYMIVNKKAYVLTFTTEQDTFDDYVKIGSLVLDSFEVKD